MVRDPILNTSDATSVAMRPFSQITVISFLNVFHQSMQQKYNFYSETSHWIFLHSHRSDSRNPRGPS